MINEISGNVVIRIIRDLRTIVRDPADSKTMDQLESRYRARKTHDIASLVEDIKAGISVWTNEIENFLSAIEILSLLSNSDNTDRLNYLKVCFSFVPPLVTLRCGLKDWINLHRIH